MSADDPCGTIQVELDRLRLCLLGEEKFDNLNVRVDFELISTSPKTATAMEGGEGDENHEIFDSSLIWSDKKTMFSTGSVSAFIEQEEKEEEEAAATADAAAAAAATTTTTADADADDIAVGAGEGKEGGDGEGSDDKKEPEPEPEPEPKQSKTFYVFNFENSGFKKTNYINFTSDMMENVCNSSIKIRVMKLLTAEEAEAQAANNHTTAPPAKGKGGKEASHASHAADDKPPEVVLLECMFPITKLFQQKASAISCGLISDGTLDLKSVQESVKEDETTMNLRISMDNELAEFTSGCACLTISNCQLTGIPQEFTLKYDDVVDPKAKVPPTDEELRQKYIENVIVLAEEKTNYNDLYSISLSGIEHLVPAATMSITSIKFDGETAKEVPPEEDIRARIDLWTYTFADAPVIFLHRSQVRSLLSMSTEVLSINGFITKESEGGDSSSDPIRASFVLDLSSITDEGVVSVPVKTPIFLPPPVAPDSAETNEEGDEGIQALPNLETSGMFGALLLASRALNETPSKITNEREQFVLPTTSSNGKIKNISDPSKDVMKEFREEIEQIVKEVAIEYVSQYPNALDAPKGVGVDGGDSVATSVGGRTQNKELEERRSAFMYFLSTQGIYHEFKEKLKPRIQRVVRKEYGPRGLALKGHDNSAWKDDDKRREMHVILSEIYIMLVKECTQVLNSMYNKTVIKLEQLEFDNGPAGKTINEESETDRQKFNRLLLVADDCRADQRLASSEQIHLQRIQFASRSKDLSFDAIALHDAYVSYAKYMLNLRKYDSSEGNIFLLDRSKEVLELAYAAIGQNHGATKITDHHSSLLLSMICIELNDLYRAEFVLASAMKCQVTTIEALDDLDGYETDEISQPIDYMTYVILSVLRSKQGAPIQARRALRLAVISYENEMMMKDKTTSLGKPKRGGVVCAVKCSLYCFDHGLLSIATFCSNMAYENDQATTAKALAKNLASDTPSYIRHLLRVSQSLVEFHNGNSTKAVELCEESANVTDDCQLQAQGYIHASECVMYGNNDNNISLNMLSKAYACDTKSLSLSAYIHLVKLLIAGVRFDEAIAVALKGFEYYPSSATLMTLIGVNCYRLERYVEAENSFLEATLLDSHNATTWMYLSLLCVSLGDTRLDEAVKAMQQALRIGTTDLKPELLRELSASFIAVDKLQIAEDLIRRTLQKELDTDGKQHPTSRKLLADILNQQNLSEKAIEEYQGVLNDETTDMENKIEVANSCLKLLNSLGRKEEIVLVESILNKLKSLEIEKQ